MPAASFSCYVNMIKSEFIYIILYKLVSYPSSGILYIHISHPCQVFYSPVSAGHDSGVQKVLIASSADFLTIFAASNRFTSSISL